MGQLLSRNDETKKILVTDPKKRVQSVYQHRTRLGHPFSLLHSLSKSTILVSYFFNKEKRLKQFP